MGPALYGVITFATAIMLYFSNLAECGIDLLGVRRVAEDRAAIQRVTPSLLGVRLLVALGSALAIALVAPRVLPQPDALVLALYALTLIALAPSTKWVHLGLQRATPVAVSRTAGEAIFLVLVLVTVEGPGDIVRVPLWQFAGDLACTILLWVWLTRTAFRPGLSFRVSEARPILERSWPLVANVLLGLTIYNSDLIFLRFFEGRATVGYYAAGYMLISFLINMAAAYSLSLLPALTRAASNRAARDRLYGDAAAHTFALALPVAVGGSLLAPAIIEAVYEDGFEPAAAALTILIWTVPFTVSKEVDLIALLVAGRERTIMRMTAAAVVVNLALNLALIPRYGMLGAAAATLATELARAAIARRCAATEAYPFAGLARRWRSLLAAAAMGLALVLAAGLPVFVTVPLGALVYGVVLLSIGGARLRPRVELLL